MLEFYEFNTFNICVVLITIFIIYYILSNTIDNSKKENDDFNVEYLIISVLVAICISLGIAYIKTGNDETIMTDNFWENNTLE